MIANDIHELLNREPFIPFRINMGSGKDYLVADPHAAALLKHEVFVVFPDGERWAHVPLLHIASIETTGNGKGRKTPRRK